MAVHGCNYSATPRRPSATTSQQQTGGAAAATKAHPRQRPRVRETRPGRRLAAGYVTGNWPPLSPCERVLERKTPDPRRSSRLFLHVWLALNAGQTFTICHLPDGVHACCEWKVFGGGGSERDALFKSKHGGDREAPWCCRGQY